MSMSLCPHCQQYHPAAATFCPNTGRALTPPPPTAPIGARLFAFLAMGLVGLGLIMAGIMLLLGRQLSSTLSRPTPTAEVTAPAPTPLSAVSPRSDGGAQAAPALAPAEPTASPLPSDTAPPSATATAAPPASAPSFTPEPGSATATSNADIAATAPAYAKVSPKDGMVVVLVPAGEFTMGSDAGDADALANERPQHPVYLDAFWIDRTEVTNKMFAAFVAVTRYQTEAEKDGKSLVWSNGDWSFVNDADWMQPHGPGGPRPLESEPVAQVSWADARAYCEWAGRRLPTEAEWEKAARGTDTRRYPWGSQPPAGDLLNFADLNLLSQSSDLAVNDGHQFAAPVGSYPRGASPNGALDMAGNVWEWVADWYSANTYASAPYANPTGPASGEVHSLRGGSWSDAAHQVRAASRVRYIASGWLDNIGFRCAVSGAAADALTPLPRAPSTTVGSIPVSSGKLIAFYSNRTGITEIYTMRADGSNVTQRTFNEAEDRQPAWSPNGQELAYQSNSTGRFEIWVLNLATNTSRMVPSTPCNNYAPVWSPDGRKFVYYADCDGNREVYTVNVDGSGARRLTNIARIYSWYPSWSPDGRQILFSSNRNGSYEVFVMNADGSAPRALAEGCKGSYSPDGRQIAYSSRCDGGGDLRIMNADGTKIRVLPDSAASGSPAWSSDGTRIVFESNRNGPTQIYATTADGAGYVRLTTGAAEDLAPAWQP